MMGFHFILGCKIIYLQFTFIVLVKFNLIRLETRRLGLLGQTLTIKLFEINQLLLKEDQTYNDRKPKSLKFPESYTGYLVATSTTDKHLSIELLFSSY